MVPQGQYSGAVREKSTGKWLQNGYETGTNDYKKVTNCRLKENSGAGIKTSPAGIWISDRVYVSELLKFLSNLF